jgi:glycyl-tRNA synthetase alpha chain
MKPAPDNIQRKYLESLEDLGFKLKEHEIRFVEGDWDAPTLGAWGLGWEVWLDGLEITQFTYFQQAGGIELPVTPVEITYGLERIAMALQNVPTMFDIQWNDTCTWGDVYRENEVEFSKYNFEEADTNLLHTLFDSFESEARALLEKGLTLPGYDFATKCSHVFNVLEARGAISISERANMIARVRALASQAAKCYLARNSEKTEAEK